MKPALLTGVIAMKKPTIRVTKWLRDIPVEATCSFCPDAGFRAQGSSHRPSREEYQRSLQTQFDEHCRLIHAEMTAAERQS